GRDERGDVGLLLHVVPNHQLPHELGKGPGELLGHDLMHIDALDRDARLAGVAVAGDRDLTGGAVPVAVGLEDDRGVVAELEADLLAARLLAPLPPGGPRSRE